MPSGLLTLVLVVVVIAYLAMGVYGAVKLYHHDNPQFFWSVSSAFWLFLAVGMVRMSRIARTITVTLMWLLVLILPFGIADPENLLMLWPALRETGGQNLRAVAIPVVTFSLFSLIILGKNRDEFR
jgi:hypothetical protein